MERDKRVTTRKKEWVLPVLAALIIFGLGFYIGFLCGRDTTVLTFSGMPEDAVIHVELDKGGN